MMMHQDCERQDEGFVPYQTMFKLPVLGVTPGFKGLPVNWPVRSEVLCVKCGDPFPLKDLLECELEENHCPHCDTTAQVHWAGIQSRAVPEYN